MGSVNRSEDHPDSRAIFYNEVAYRSVFELRFAVLRTYCPVFCSESTFSSVFSTITHLFYSKKKIGDFLSALEGFQNARKLSSLFQDELGTMK